jgi:hypothetical protein
MGLVDGEGNDWGALHFGALSKLEIDIAICDPTWQQVRASIKGRSMGAKHRACLDYLKFKENTALAQIAVTNYTNALKRAGLVYERENS